MVAVFQESGVTVYFEIHKVNNSYISLNSYQEDKFYTTYNPNYFVKQVLFFNFILREKSLRQ